MNFPSLILKETEQSGIRGSIFHFADAAVRVYQNNILFIQLKHILHCQLSDKSFSLEEGQLLFLPEGLSIQLSATDSYTLLLSIPSAALQDHQYHIRCCSADTSDQAVFQPLRQILRDLFHTEYHGGNFYQIQSQALLKQLIYELLSTFYVTELSYGNTPSLPALKKAPQHDSSFHKILEILEQHYASELKLNQLAEAFYYTPSTLSKMFMRYTGLHFSEYLTELRLQKAISLLTQTTLDISVIAERAGFPNPRAFQQAFQKKYKLRPSAYRREYSDTNTDSYEENRRNLYAAMQLGLLKPILESDTVSKEPLGLRHHLGSYSMTNVTTTDISRKNCVLNIYRAKDLLLNEIQEIIRELQKKIGFRYLNCHGFLANDMQIYFEDKYHFHFSDHGRHLQYNFHLYEKILQFIKSQQLYAILNLGYMPTVLSRISDDLNTRPDSSVAMPESMEEWTDYLCQMFTFFQQRFGDWVKDCPVLLWQVPDVYIYNLHTFAEDDFFQLYLYTWRTVKELIPEIEVGSPTISCSHSGLIFAKRFLSFCMENHCFPDSINITYISRQQAHLLFHVQGAETSHFVEELRRHLRLLNADPLMPIHMLEYYHTFDLYPLCDSMAGSMLPIRHTLQNHTHFERFGYWTVSDLTTETIYGRTQFAGGRGIFSNSGGKKPLFYALQFLSRLGSECLGMGEGFVLTRINRHLQLLLYYDISESQWIEPFTSENALAFYEMYLDKIISLDITDLDADSYLIREQFLNYENGSAFEEWLRSGGPFLAEAGLDDMVYHSHPQIITRTEKELRGHLHYETTLKPFELRFVDIMPFSVDIKI